MQQRNGPARCEQRGSSANRRGRRKTCRRMMTMRCCCRETTSREERQRADGAQAEVSAPPAVAACCGDPTCPAIRPPFVPTISIFAGADKWTVENGGQLLSNQTQHTTAMTSAAVQTALFRPDGSYLQLPRAGSDCTPELASQAAASVREPHPEAPNPHTHAPSPSSPPARTRPDPWFQAVQQQPTPCALGHSRVPLARPVRQRSSKQEPPHVHIAPGETSTSRA